MQFQCSQIKHVIPQLWKDNIKNFAIKCYKVLNLEKLSSKELYKIQLPLKYEKPICQVYHEKKFGNYNFNWKIIYGITRIAIQKFISSSINSSIMFYILIKIYIDSELCLALNVPSVIYMMKPHSIYFMNVFLHKISGPNLKYILQKRMIYQS